MLAVLEEKRKRADARDIETRVMDGQALDLADDAFDVAGSSLGLVFFPSPERGLAELRRVLRPDGRVFVASLQDPVRAPLMRLVIGALLSAVPDFRPAAPPGIVQLSSPEAMRTALEAAGFADVRVETETVPWIIDDPADFWDRWALDAPPTAAMMAGVAPEARAAGRASFVELIESERKDGVAAFPSQVLIGTGRKPAAR